MSEVPLYIGHPPILNILRKVTVEAGQVPLPIEEGTPAVWLIDFVYHSTLGLKKKKRRNNLKGV